jgi:UDP-N-acetylglucosamine 2-epimerase (non-hydrolysing)
MREVLTYFSAKIEESVALATFQLDREGYFLVSAHREENVDDKARLATLLETLEMLSTTFSKRVLFSTHPRTRGRIESFRLSAGPSIEFVKPLGFFDYVQLERNAFCVISDSGTLTEESSILGFPAVAIRESHERPEGMDEGTLIMTGLDRARVVDAVRVLKSERRDATRAPLDYLADNVSTKVVRIILSYVDFVRRTVWYE